MKKHMSHMKFYSMNQGNLGATCLTFWNGSTFTGIYLTKPISIIGIQLVCDHTFQVHDTSVIYRD